MSLVAVSFSFRGQYNAVYRPTYIGLDSCAHPFYLKEIVAYTRGSSAALRFVRYQEKKGAYTTCSHRNDYTLYI